MAARLHNSGKILVTGAAGLIGDATVSLLAEKGFQVVAVDNFTIGTARYKHPQVSWIEMDVSEGDLDQMLQGLQVKTVVHAAAHPGGLSLKEPALDVKVNAFGSMRLFEWCTKNDCRVIYLSSSAVYGEKKTTTQPLKETDPVDPNTVYAVCKTACEQYLKILHAGYGLNYLVLRLFATYGAGHKPSKFQGIVNVLLTQLLEGDKITVKGSLRRVRDLVYVSDVARAIISAVEKTEVNGEVINIGAESNLTIGELISALGELLGKPVDKLQIEEAGGTVGDPFYNVADGSKAEKLLGFRPEVNLRAGLAKLIDSRTRSV